MSDHMQNCFLCPCNRVFDSKNIKFIHARAFDKKDKHWKYVQQAGICPYCHRHFDESEMQGDHIKPWSKGGVTERENLQMLCIECNAKKSGYDTGFTPWDDNEYEAFDVAKWDRAMLLASLSKDES